ncbi:MAG: hypothetical protein KAI94_07550 [Anaerolineales bacterium]|nr:hypothetical protein [Anaerolineales bacterium]
MYRATSSVSPVEIEVISYEPAEWGDSCLGLAFPDEMCAEVITPGWVVVLGADQGGEAAFYTDQLGTIIRRAPEDELAIDEIPVSPAATRTGIEEVDRLVEAILSNQVDARRALVHFAEVGCTTADGLGGPPKCEPAEQDGTPVEVLPILGTEGHHVRRASIDRALSFNVEGLYAIYLVPEDVWQDESYPAGEYGLVFILFDNPFPMTVHVKEGGIVRLDFHTGITPAEVIEPKGGELILPAAAGAGN